MNPKTFLLVVINSVMFSTMSLWGATQPAISAGYNHSLFLKSDGTVWSCGANWAGQVGDGTFIDRNVPIQVIDDIVAIAAGEMHSLFVKTDGTVWATGAGNDGRLGDGSLQDKKIPVQVQISGVKSVATGKDFSLFLKADGTVWGCGSKSNGQLGLSEGSGNPSVPVQIPISDVVSISAGYNQSLFLKLDGTIWATGYNGRYWSGGPLGDGTNLTVYTPKQIMTGCMGVSVSGTQMGAHSLFLNSDGTVKSTGDNGFGQLGDGTRTGRYVPVDVLLSGSIKSVATGAYQSFFVKEDLTLWACGYNQRGGLGIPGSGQWYSVPVQVQENIIGIASGTTHSIFLKADGSVWTSGTNDKGALGNGSWTDRGTPVEIMSLAIFLNATATDGGIVSGNGVYNLNDTATITASPSLGYLFTGWTGDLSGSTNPLILTMDASKSVRANFKKNLTDGDLDGLTYYDEVILHGTNPTLKDTDGDGFEDLFEVNTGFNPALATSTPDALSTIRTAVEFRFNAASGVSYRIESSTDLDVWNTVETDIIGAGAVITRFYTIENLPKRYFRARRN